MGIASSVGGYSCVYESPLHERKCAPMSTTQPISPYDQIDLGLGATKSRGKTHRRPPRQQAKRVQARKRKKARAAPKSPSGVDGRSARPQRGSVFSEIRRLPRRKRAGRGLPQADHAASTAPAVAAAATLRGARAAASCSAGVVRAPLAAKNGGRRARGRKPRAAGAVRVRTSEAPQPKGRTLLFSPVAAERGSGSRTEAAAAASAPGGTVKNSVEHEALVRSLSTQLSSMILELGSERFDDKELRHETTRGGRRRAHGLSGGARAGDADFAAPVVAASDQLERDAMRSRPKPTRSIHDNRDEVSPGGTPPTRADPSTWSIRHKQAHLMAHARVSPRSSTDAHRPRVDSQSAVNDRSSTPTKTGDQNKLSHSSEPVSLLSGDNPGVHYVGSSSASPPRAPVSPVPSPARSIASTGSGRSVATRGSRDSRGSSRSHGSRRRVTRGASSRAVVSCAVASEAANSGASSEPCSHEDQPQPTSARSSAASTSDPSTVSPRDRARLQASILERRLRYRLHSKEGRSPASDATDPSPPSGTLPARLSVESPNDSRGSRTPSPLKGSGWEAGRNVSPLLRTMTRGRIEMRRRQSAAHRIVDIVWRALARKRAMLLRLGRVSTVEDAAATSGTYRFLELRGQAIEHEAARRIGAMVRRYLSRRRVKQEAVDSAPDVSDERLQWLNSLLVSAQAVKYAAHDTYYTVDTAASAATTLHRAKRPQTAGARPRSSDSSGTPLVTTSVDHTRPSEAFSWHTDGAGVPQASHTSGGNYDTSYQYQQNYSYTPAGVEGGYEGYYTLGTAEYDTYYHGAAAGAYGVTHAAEDTGGWVDNGTWATAGVAAETGAAVRLDSAAQQDVGAAGHVDDVYATWSTARSKPSWPAPRGRPKSASVLAARRNRHRVSRHASVATAANDHSSASYSGGTAGPTTPPKPLYGRQSDGSVRRPPPPRDSQPLRRPQSAAAGIGRLGKSKMCVLVIVSVCTRT